MIPYDSSKLVKLARKQWTLEDAQNVVRLREQGYTSMSIAEAYGSHYYTLVCMIRRFGLTLPCSGKRVRSDAARFALTEESK